MCENTSYVGVRLLDTAAGGTDLMADSRLAVIERNFRDLGRQPQERRASLLFRLVHNGCDDLDGRLRYRLRLLNEHPENHDDGIRPVLDRTGKMNHVVGLVHFGGKAPIGISLYWVNSTGKIAIGTSETSGGGRVGVMNGNTFTPLPGVTGFEAIAW